MDSSAWTNVLFAVITTYAFHSTVLLATAWAADVLCRLKSHALRERFWKWAAVAPLLTVPVQMNWSQARPVLKWTMNDHSGSLFSDSAETRTRLISRDGDVGRGGVNSEAVDARQFQPSHPARPPVREREIPSGLLTDLKDHPHSKHNDAVAFRSDLNTGEAQDENSAIKITAGSPMSAAEVEAVLLEIQRVDEPQAVSGALSGNRVSSIEKISPTPAILPALQPARQRIAKMDTTSIRLMTVWIVMVWMSMGAIWLVIQECRIRWLLRHSVPVADGIAVRTLSKITAMRKVQRPIRLLHSASVSEPAACGVFRWTIMIPTGMQKQLTEEDYRALLAHELAHLVRHDTLWLCIARILRFAFGWQPLNIVATRSWQQSAEFLCDFWAVESGVTGTSLARCLTRIAGWRKNRKICPGIAASADSLTRRVETLLEKSLAADRWLHGWRRRFCSVALLTVVVLIASFAPGTTWSISSEVNAQGPGQAATADSKQPRLEGSSKSDAQLHAAAIELQQLYQDLKLAQDLLHRNQGNAVVAAYARMIEKRVNTLRVHLTRLQRDAKY